MPYRDQNEHTQLAHGLNEELTIILNSVWLTAQMLGPEHPAAPAISDLRQSAVRCTELTRKLVRR